MKKIFKALKPIGIVTFLVLSVIACDSEFNSIDSNVLGKDNANFNVNKRNTPVTAYNKKLSALQINGLNTNLLGVYNDPVYGRTTASIVAQILPLSYNPDFGTNPVIDSVMLNIPYFSRTNGVDEEGNTVYVMNEQDSLYGNGKIKLSIYKSNYLLRDLNPDPENPETQNYFSFAENTPDNSQNFIKTENITVNLDDQKGELLIKVDDFLPSNEPVEITNSDGESTTMNPPALRVDLHEEGSAFWKTTIIDKQDGTELSNANNFKNYFRGLYIKAESIGDEGNMMLLNLASSSANITIYYSKESASDSNARVQATYTFNFSGTKINPLINDYSTAPEPLVDGDPANGDEKLYLKGAAGSMAVIDLFTPEDLEDLRAEFFDGENPTKLINEAHLIILEDRSLVLNDKAHQYDRIYAYDVKNNIPLIDYSFDPSENTNIPYDSKVIHLGIRDTIGTDQRGYKIRITEHLKNLLYKDSTNTKLGLVLSNNVNYTNTQNILNSNDDVNKIPAATILTSRGTVLYGSNNTEDKKLKLEIFYTEPTN